MNLMANMLSSIKNISMAKKVSTEVYYSKECESVAKILKDRGFLTEVKVFKPKDLSYKMMNLSLAFDGIMPIVTDVKIVSKPGRRIYKGYDEIFPVLGGLGVLVVSTSRGIMDGKEAKKKKLGGEIICEVR